MQLTRILESNICLHAESKVSTLENITCQTEEESLKNIIIYSSSLHLNDSIK